MGGYMNRHTTVQHPHPVKSVNLPNLSASTSQSSLDTLRATRVRDGGPSPPDNPKASILIKGCVCVAASHSATWYYAY
jgi:hypothetical protein